jgi:hypothetical protein
VRYAPGGILATCVCFAGSIFPAAPAAAQTPACPAGVAVTPAFKAADPLHGNRPTVLTATHVIAVTAEFPEGGPITADDFTAKWTGPPGVPMITHRSRNADDVDIGGPNQIGFEPKAAGPLPVSVTWQQSDGTRSGMCTGSASTTLKILAAKPLHPGRPRGTSAASARDDSEYTWDTNIAADSDRRPLEVRVRSVRGAHLPGPRVAFKTVTIALRPTDPGWEASRQILAPFLQVIATNEGSFAHLIVHMRRVTANPKLGYELVLRQGKRRVGRIRAAGSCSAFGCDFSTFRVQR